MIKKNGVAYPDTAPDETYADLGAKIRYTLEYDNIGNTDALNSEISEIIPAGTCYIYGTIENNLPTGATVKYYDI
ncbi:MAG: hypothetical protein H6546_07030 [Chitinophagales bacterium]|nr:hypothetical protein [Chitinophagales bacterium]